VGDGITCPDCGTDVESADQLTDGPEVTELETDDDGSIRLYGNRDLFLCENCRRPLGVGGS